MTIIKKITLIHLKRNLNIIIPVKPKQEILLKLKIKSKQKELTINKI
jgi:hypothetical protein